MNYKEAVELHDWCLDHGIIARVNYKLGVYFVECASRSIASWQPF